MQYVFLWASGHQTQGPPQAAHTLATPLGPRIWFQLKKLTKLSLKLIAYIFGFSYPRKFKKRFPLEEWVVASLAILDPAAAQDLTKYHSSVANVAYIFPILCLKTSWIFGRWLEAIWAVQRFSLSTKSIPDFWYSLSNIKQGLDNLNSGILSDFMTKQTVLPHSSDLLITSKQKQPP